MQNKSAQQIAEEMVEQISKNIELYLISCPISANRDDLKHIILNELNLTRLIEDKMMLDWLEHRNVTYFFSEFACRADNLRQAIKSAMKKEQDK